jgi:hypothetical protein
MLFGATPFSNSPFADPGGVSIFVTVSGQRMNFAIGNVKLLKVNQLFYLQDKELI